MGTAAAETALWLAKIPAKLFGCWPAALERLKCDRVCVGEELLTAAGEPAEAVAACAAAAAATAAAAALDGTVYGE